MMNKDSELLNWHSQKMAEMLIEKWSEVNISGHFVSSGPKALEKILSLFNKDQLVSWGGSKTLEQIGIIQHLRDEKFNIIDSSNPKLDRSVVLENRRKALLSDVFLTGTNAITLDGKLVNVDGFGNRVAAMIYGPKKVIIVAGTNKIVTDEGEAMSRIKTFTAPINAKRLNKNTPCVQSGLCQECNSDDRICSAITIIERQALKDRMHIILVSEHLGL